jgi:hypothetical protein
MLVFVAFNAERLEIVGRLIEKVIVRDVIGVQVPATAAPYALIPVSQPCELSSSFKPCRPDMVLVRRLCPRLSKVEKLLSLAHDWNSMMVSVMSRTSLSTIIPGIDVMSMIEMSYDIHW